MESKEFFPNFVAIYLMMEAGERHLPTARGLSARRPTCLRHVQVFGRFQHVGQSIHRLIRKPSVAATAQTLAAGVSSPSPLLLEFAPTEPIRLIKLSPSIIRLESQARKGASITQGREDMEKRATRKSTRRNRLPGRWMPGSASGLNETQKSRVAKRLKAWRDAYQADGKRLTADQVLALLDCVTFALDEKERAAFFRGATRTS